MDWMNVLAIVMPTIITLASLAIALILKVKKDEFQGMSKEVAELLVAVIEAAKDKYFTQDEILRIIREGEDVIREAEKLLSSK